MLKLTRHCAASLVMSRRSIHQGNKGKDAARGELLEQTGSSKLGQGGKVLGKECNLCFRLCGSSLLSSISLLLDRQKLAEAVKDSSRDRAEDHLTTGPPLDNSPNQAARHGRVEQVPHMQHFLCFCERQPTTKCGELRIWDNVAARPDVTLPLQRDLSAFLKKQIADTNLKMLSSLTLDVQAGAGLKQKL